MPRIRSTPADKEPEIASQTVKDSSTPVASLPESLPKKEPFEPFPVPRRQVLPPREFFEYWGRLGPQFAKRLMVYAYRKLPICDVLQPLSSEELQAIRDHQKREPEKNIDKPERCFVELTDLDQWGRQLAERYGAGDYHFKLNDTHPSVKKTICMMTTKGEVGELRDWDSFPPVLKLEEVVLTEEVNQPYLRWARAHGIRFPGDPNYGTDGVEEDDMANTTVVEKVLEQNAALTQQVIAKAKEEQPKPAGNAAPPADIATLITEAVKQSSDQAYKNSERGQEFLLGAVKAANDLNAKAADPASHTNQVIEMAKVLSAPFERILDIQQKSAAAVIESLTKRIEAAETRMTAATTAANPSAAATAAGDQFGLGDIVKDIVRKKLLGEDEPESFIPSGKGHPWWAEGILKLIDVGPQFAGQIAFGIKAAALAAANAPANGTAPAGAPVQTATVPVMPNAPSIPQHQPTPQEQAQMQQIQILKSLEVPLERALSIGQHGSDFAVEMIRAQGTPDLYNALSSQTAPQLMQQLQQLQFMGVGIWSIALKFPQRFESFLTEFLDRATVSQKLQNQAPAPPVEVIPPNPPAASQEGSGRKIIDPATGLKIRTVSVQPIQPA